MLVWVFLLWFLILCLLMVILGHRIWLTSRLFEFDTDHSNPLDACASFNRYLLAELILHTIFIISVLLMPNYSIVIFAVNAPLVARSWFLFKQGRFYFSPFHIVRDNKVHQTWCFVFIGVFGFSAVCVVFKLLFSLLM